MTPHSHHTVSGQHPASLDRRQSAAGRIARLVLPLVALLLWAGPAAAEGGLATEFGLLIGHPSAEGADEGVLVVPGIVIPAQSDARLDEVLAGDGGEEEARRLVRNARLQQVADNLAWTLRLDEVEVRYQTRVALESGELHPLPAPVSTSDVQVSAKLLGYNENSASYAVQFTEGAKLIIDTPVTVKRGKQAVVGGLDGEDAPYLFLVIAPDAAGRRAPVDKLLRVAGDVKPPIAIKKVPTIYPPEAREKGIQGPVIVQSVITVNGDVSRLKVLKGQPGGLNQAALDSIRRWKFEPATLDGEPVEVAYNLTINFRRGPSKSKDGKDLKERAPKEKDEDKAPGS
ncbi:MAG: energy transducer TonB [Acidobacteriota bacterium]